MADEAAEREENIVADWLIHWRGHVSLMNSDAFIDLMSRIDTALLTHAREARRLALEEAAQIADDWGDLARNETQSGDADVLYRLSAAIRALKEPTR